MAKSRHRGAFVVGSVMGGAVGAVAALWKTPQSGEELRRKLGFESEAAHGVAAAAKTVGHTAGDVASTAKPLPGRVLGLVERAAAPLVGVKLGQTANNSQPAMPAPKVQANADVTAEVDITAPDATKAL
ncbi:MAG: YtxH domain-containing protein [Chloroflexia bacterium]|nr:YtxH domain-containing protein [Chloroflexia bacterium]